MVTYNGMKMTRTAVGDRSDWIRKDHSIPSSRGPAMILFSFWRICRVIKRFDWGFSIVDVFHKHFQWTRSAVWSSVFLGPLLNKKYVIFYIRFLVFSLKVVFVILHLITHLSDSLTHFNAQYVEIFLNVLIYKKCCTKVDSEHLNQGIVWCWTVSFNIWTTAVSWN